MIWYILTEIYFSAIGILLPYVAVYMRQLGLSPTESAIILSLSSILTAISRTIIGMIADKLRKHVIVLICCCLVSGVVHLSLLFVPHEARNMPSQVHLNASELDVSCLNVSNSELLLCRLPLDTRVLPLVISDDKSSNWSLEESDGEMQCCNNTLMTSEALALNVSQSSQCATYLHPVSTYRLSMNLYKICVHSPNDGLRNDTLDLLETCNQVELHLRTAACLNSTKNISDVVPVNVVSYFGKTFWIFLALYIVASSSFGPIINVVDGVACTCLNNDRANFGRQRCWGSVGFGLFGVLSSLIMDLFQTSSTDKNYTYTFVLFLIFLLATSVIVYRIQAVVQVIAGSLMSNVGKILCDLELDFLLVTAFISGYLCGAQEGFLFWYIQSLGGPQILMGLCGFIQCLVEILILFYSGVIIVKFGTVICLCAVFTAFGVRFLLYSFLINPWCVLSIEPLHSICYGLFYPAIAVRASELTPAGMHATVQSFLGTLYMSIGKLLLVKLDNGISSDSHR